METVIKANRKEPVYNRKKELNDIRSIVFSSIFLSLAILFVLIQIPIGPYLAIDFSLIVVLIGRKYVSLWYITMICLIYPWFAIFSFTKPTDVLSSIILIICSLTFVYVNELFYNNETKRITMLNSLFSILIVSFILTFLNIFLFQPLYLGLSNFDIWFTELFKNPRENIIFISTVILPFNLVKFSSIYLLYFLSSGSHTSYNRYNYER